MLPFEIGQAAAIQWKAWDLTCPAISLFRIFGVYLTAFVLVYFAMDL